MVPSAHAPEWLHGILILGLFRGIGAVISVMLPPMAIFFPMFALLENYGYLPRVAFNMDRLFKRWRTRETIFNNGNGIWL